MTRTPTIDGREDLLPLLLKPASTVHAVTICLSW